MILQADSLSRNQIASQGFSLLCDRLKENPHIRCMSLKGNELDDECMKSLGEFLKVNSALESLEIRGNGITSKGFEVLAPYLKENKSLKQVLFDGDVVTDKSLPLFIKMIEGSCIEKLDLSSMSIGQGKELMFSTFANILKNKTTNIDLASMHVNDEDVSRLCDISNKYDVEHVKAIELGGNEITGKGFSTLFKSLNNCKSLESLYLGWNSINDECINDLVNFLKKCPNIKLLDLSGRYTMIYGMNGEQKSAHGKLTSEAVTILSSWVIGNPTIKRIDLSYNDKILNKSLLVLIEMIEKSSIEQFDFEGKSSIFQGKLVIPLVTNKLRCNNLIQLDLSRKNLHNDDIITICGLLKKFDSSKLEMIK